VPLGQVAAQHVQLERNVMTPQIPHLQIVVLDNTVMMGMLTVPTVQQVIINFTV